MDFIKMVEENMNRLEETDKKAKDAGQLVGRLIKHSYADGYAYYQVVKETARTCKVQVCSGIGDDWVLPAWGKSSVISKKTIKSLIERADEFEKLFSHIK